MRHSVGGAPIRKVPAGVSCYVGAIYLGYSMEVVLSGDSQTFHAGLKARFLTHTFGDLRTEAVRSGLRLEVQGRGLTAAGPELAMVKSPDDISRSYRRSDKPVPILVEYRSFPSTPFDVGQSIAFAPPPPSFYRYTIQILSAGIEPGRCSGNCDLVVEVSSPGEDEKPRVVAASGESTNNPSFGGKILVRDVDVSALRNGFTIRVGDKRWHGGVDNIATCQLLLGEDEYMALAAEEDRTGEYDLPCDDGVTLSLRVLMNEPSDDPGMPSEMPESALRASGS